MGELVVNSEVEMELQVEDKKNTAGGGGSGAVAAAGDSSVVNWERFLPKMVRVMLVEADDSTRQIIAALLRKCSYRVAAVPDGLKAWELLKGRPQSIDLILTEVELPSISGYALLTLIMEHESCKNIPVIMMSSHDSVSTVYNCMLRGAADFLVKPVRKNELRNLWQHVWRKQASSTGVGLGPPDESVAQGKDEMPAVSNHSSGRMSSVGRNNHCLEKGSDAQSSSTRPAVEAEGEVECDQYISLLKTGKCLLEGNINTFTREECRKESRKRRHDDENGESLEADRTTIQPTKTPRHGWESGDSIAKYNDVLEKSSTVAIDLIGTFDNNLKETVGNSALNGVINKFNALPPLDLSLRPQLNHSDASPFSRYVNKSLQLHNSMLPSSCDEHTTHKTNPEKRSSRHILELNSQICCPPSSSPKQISVATVQTQQQHETFPYSHCREVSHPIPFRGVRFDHMTSAYDSVMPSIYSVKSGSQGASHCSGPLSQLNTFHPANSRPSTSQQFLSLVDLKLSKSIDQTEAKLGEKLEDQRHIPPENDQSASSSYCNGNMSHNQSTGSGSHGKLDAVSIFKTAPSECGNEERLPVLEGSSHRSIQREAALTKFRQKRKDRCFEKKVRYESRKKLAEQRPRVKGQFVRQVLPHPQPAGNTSTG
ncbi:two-component response regulator-like APRR3 [Andrographis paniculata]|uniref:two-component response regulator-like APRR3 n=1 Tax=Andrographis paniculata TaxID=175694 RepID=UPI0021E7DCCF|nr:two-component response regulator-like APRR3 [Andrographis paniculata]